MADTGVVFATKHGDEADRSLVSPTNERAKFSPRAAASHLTPNSDESLPPPGQVLARCGWYCRSRPQVRASAIARAWFTPRMEAGDKAPR
jgi:hypothetical protein